MSKQSSVARKAACGQRRSAGLLILAVGVVLAAPQWGLAQADDPPAVDAKQVEPEAADPGDEDKAQATEKAQPAAIGRLVRLPLPITNRVDTDVKRTIERTLTKLRAERKNKTVPITLILEFSPPPTKKAGDSDFSRALSLALFLTQGSVSDVKTVAYIPRSIEGHAVLVAMACDEIVMGPDAEIGGAGILEDPKAEIGKPMLTSYLDMAERRRTINPALAQGLLDQNVEVLKLDTDQGVRYVLRQDLEKLKSELAVRKEEVVFAGGEERKLSAKTARDYGVARYIARDRMSLANGLGLPASALEVDPQVEGALRAVTINVSGRINWRMAETRMLMIRKAMSKPEINMICLRIDSPGGDPGAALKLAGFIARQPTDRRVLTVAYVPHEALGVAALVAVACDQLVMQTGARIGGGNELPDAEKILEIRGLLKSKEFQQRGRTWSLPAALMDNKLPVHEYTNVRTGQSEYFSAEELAEQPDKEKADWKIGQKGQITNDGSALNLSAEEAQLYGLVRDDAVVEDFDRLKTLYGLEHDPTFAEPGWEDALVRILSSRGVSVLLVMFGMAGLYIELKTPGLGIGGFVAALSFVLFFWANYLEQTADVLEIVLFVAGLAFLALEVFVLPGVGIFGLGGGLMVIASLVLASQTFILPQTPSQIRELRDSLLVVGGAGVGVIAMAVLLRHYLPKSRFLQPMVLEPPEGLQAAEQSARESLADYRHLMDAEGATITPLTPAGKARFGDEVVDVISDGQWISPGSPIVVVAVRGSRVEVAERG